MVRAQVTHAPSPAASQASLPHCQPHAPASPAEGVPGPYFVNEGCSANKAPLANEGPLAIADQGSWGCQLQPKVPLAPGAPHAPSGAAVLLPRPFSFGDQGTFWGDKAPAARLGRWSTRAAL